MSTEQKSEQEVYTEDYLDFHKTWENQMNSCVISLNNCRSSDEVTPIIRNIEELETQLRNFPYSRPEDQAMNLRELGDVLDEAKFKFTHTRKQELAEQNKLLQAQIDAWGLPSKPANEPFQVILSKKKGRRNSGDDGQESKKAKTTDEVETQTNSLGFPFTTKTIWKWSTHRKEPPQPRAIPVSSHPRKNSTFLPSTSIMWKTRQPCSIIYRTSPSRSWRPNLSAQSSAFTQRLLMPTTK
ncbi:hypothetical protein TNCV_4517021 [Trichonephila clavipes]|nr:hypothetical protein TNCV_4517021 [Trichonephila clavipes]